MVDNTAQRAHNSYMMNATESKMDKLTASKIVRGIMQSHGKEWIFNNIYECGTRTVKCYGTSENRPLVDNIKTVLFVLNVPHKIKFTDGRAAGGRGAKAIIVKLV